ncbi:lysine-sensitive aspartokinase 3, partial [Vibrio parahaemolyticus]|nr:lysine-sensitive aspartokinase 3 [Vibrio parahaemolyticus]
NPDTRLVVSSACSGVTNLLVELANGVQAQERRNQILSQLAEIHDAILNQLQDASETAAEVYALLDTVTTLAEAASIQA